MVFLAANDGHSEAMFSDNLDYRYMLSRRWGDEYTPYVLVIGLNPSTADHEKDDPTIRRCVQFAKDWGMNTLFMANLFAYRATNPVHMKQVDEPIGPDNDKVLVTLAGKADLVVAAWGRHGSFKQRDIAVLDLLSESHVECLGVNIDGSPKHPLYLPKTSRLRPYRPPSHVIL